MTPAEAAPPLSALARGEDELMRGMGNGSGRRSSASSFMWTWRKTADPGGKSMGNTWEKTWENHGKMGKHGKTWKHTETIWKIWGVSRVKKGSPKARWFLSWITTMDDD